MKVLITDYQYENIDQERRIIDDFGAELVDLEKNPKNLTLEEAVKDADAIIVQYAEITPELIDKMTQCKMIVKYGIGVNNIHVEAATEKGIYVCNVPDYGVDEVSNHAIAMLLALHRKLSVVANGLREGDWSYGRMVPTKRLKGSTLGLVGLGRIPSLVAEKMTGFGLDIIAYDPYIAPDQAKRLGVKLVDFETLCTESDLISIHCALTDETKHMFNKDIFKKMKKHAILVNTARGPIIHEADLIEALKNGEIAAAGLDTYETEPISQDNPLLRMDNVICTPHIAWYTEDAIRNVQRGAAKEAVNVLAGNLPFHAVNKPSL